MEHVRLPLLPRDAPVVDTERDIDPSVFAGQRHEDGRDYLCGECGGVLVARYDYERASLQIADAVIRCPQCGARNAFDPRRAG